MKILNALHLSFFVLSTLSFSIVQASSIRGYVVKGPKRVSGVEVAIYMNQAEQITEIARKTSDVNGEFIFRAPFMKPGIPFALTAFYQGIPYQSSTLEVAAQEEIIIEVFDTTSVDKHLRIDTHHIFLSVNESAVDVVQLIQMQNEKVQTFAGTMKDGFRHVSKFVLDENLFDLQNFSGHFHQTNENTFFDSQPLPPGETQLSFSFKLNANKLNNGYNHDVIYPTARLEIFVQPTTIEVSNKWEDLGLIDLHGSTYRRILKRNLASGDSMFVKLPLPLELRSLLKWSALAACIIISVFAIRGKFEPRLKLLSNPSVRNAKLLDEKRKILLLKIAHLDQRFTSEKNNTVYLDQRKQLISDALKISKQLKVK